MFYFNDYVRSVFIMTKAYRKTVVLREDQYKDLTRLCAENKNVSYSFLLKEAVDFYLDKMKKEGALQ